jgi:hypothetical protein
MTRAPARILLLCLCGFTLAACCVAPALASVNVNVVVPAPYLVISAGERHQADLLLLTALAMYLGADVNVVVPLYPRWSFDDIAIILVIGRHCHRSPDYVIGMRRRHHGWGWGQVAHSLGVHPGAFNQRRVWDKKHDREVGDPIVMRCVSGYWGIPLSDVHRLRQRSYPVHEIALAANVASWSGRPLRDVVTWRSQKHSWSAVADHFRVAPQAIKEPKGKYGSAGGKGRAKPGKVSGPQAKHGKGQEDGTQAGKGPKEHGASGKEHGRPGTGPKGGEKPSKGHSKGHGQ